MDYLKPKKEHKCDECKYEYLSKEEHPCSVCRWRFKDRKLVVLGKINYFEPKEEKGLNQCIRCKYEHDSAIDEPCVSCSKSTSHFEPKEHDEIDMVNHPQHYNRDGAMECIDEMIAVFGKDIVACFCLCNVWKYRYRASDKGHEEDLSKSDYYMAKYKELITGRSVLGFESVMEREELEDIVMEKLDKLYLEREIRKHDK